MSHTSGLVTSQALGGDAPLRADLSPQETDLGCPLTGLAISEKRTLSPRRAVSQYLFCSGMPNSEGGWVKKQSVRNNESLDHFEVVEGEVTASVSDD